MLKTWAAQTNEPNILINPNTKTEMWSGNTLLIPIQVTKCWNQRAWDVESNRKKPFDWEHNIMKVWIPYSIVEPLFSARVLALGARIFVTTTCSKEKWFWFYWVYRNIFCLRCNKEHLAFTYLYKWKHLIVCTNKLLILMHIPFFVPSWVKISI